jgi:hypothetical protein
MKKRATQHSGRKSSKGAFSPKHNDRDYDFENANNINKDITENNLYYNFYDGVYKHEDKGDKMTFEKAEAKFYKQHFNKQWVDINWRYQLQRHSEKCKSFEDWCKMDCNLPEEVYFQIGDKENHIDSNTFINVFNTYNKALNDWNKKNGSPFTVLDIALHFDEAVPQAHMRRIWHSKSIDGTNIIGQEKALEKAGIQLPKPNEKKGRYNNRKMVFDKMARGMWLDACKQHGLDIETVPVPGVRHNMSKDETIAVKFAEKQKELDDREAHIRELEAKAEKYALNAKEALKTSNTSSEGYLKYQNQWMKKNGYSEACLKDYSDYIDSQYPNVSTRALNDDYSL